MGTTPAQQLFGCAHAAIRTHQLLSDQGYIMKNKPFAIVKRYDQYRGPKGGLVCLGWDVVEVSTNITLRRLPSAKLARELRDNLNYGRKYFRLD
jgi:hypothetical protein